jgi:hypothetical protein
MCPSAVHIEPFFLLLFDCFIKYDVLLNFHSSKKINYDCPEADKKSVFKHLGVWRRPGLHPTGSCCCCARDDDDHDVDVMMYVVVSTMDGFPVRVANDSCLSSRVTSDDTVTRTRNSSTNMFSRVVRAFSATAPQAAATFRVATASASRVIQVRTMAEQSALDFRFDGKRAVVTGAGKGIGYDACIALAKSGAQVIAVSRTQADLDKLLAEVGDRITPVLVDISDVAATKKVLREVGDIDLVVNNGECQNLFFC